ncbi:uncharacterized protein ARMOST_14867 [Armillaria ostoyae]|uniref:Uncharacterized protein n=1 Tax=Armillaria ostoyae TaxID=47428 RepID=A0A284RRS4_ARMOS|nr:uncharacterized protein ARMOST_14867 [Armillaria ostoyae]
MTTFISFGAGVREHVIDSRQANAASSPSVLQKQLFNVLSCLKSLLSFLDITAVIIVPLYSASLSQRSPAKLDVPYLHDMTRTN